MAVEQAPKKETAQLARSHGPRKKKDAAGSAQPSTAFVPKGPPKPPEDHSVPGVKKDPMPANGYLAEDKEHHATEVAKQQPKTNGLPPAVKAAMDNVRAITETEVLIATMSSVGDKNGRWKFLNTLDRIDDPGVRAMVREKFEQRTHQSLDTFIKNAHWYSKRDREQAEDMVGENRKHAEEQNAADAAAKPEEYAKKKNQAIAWAAAVLQVTRKDDPDSDSEAKAIFDTLGPRSPEEIEMIRAEIRRQTGGRTAYQEMDKSLSGGTEDEAVAGLKGNPINAVKEGIKNADGNSKRIQELLGRLDDKQLLQLNCENPMLAGFAINSVADDQKATIGALMKGDRAHANAEHIADLFKDPMDGAQLEGPMMSKQTQANIENRKPENIINELRAMSPDAIHAAREAWNKEHGDGAWDEMVTKRFKGDDHMLMRMRSLADGNKMEERAYALRQGMAEHNQKLIEDAISNPDLENDQDPAKKAIALTQRAELEARVMTLELNADRAAAQMTGKDPNAVVPETMQQQLDGYYKEYGAKAPQPKDYDEMLSYVSDKDAYQKKHEKKNDANKLATGEIETHGDVSTVTKIIRAEEKNDQQTKSQLLENLKSNDERDKVAEQYAARNEGKSIYEDPRKGDFAAMANYKKEVLGDDRPLSEIQQEIADESRNSNQNRIHNVQTYGVKAARTPEIELKLQTEQLKLQHSDSLENSEIMREYMGGNIGTEDLAKHQLENMKDQVESTTHWDDASLAEFKARDKAMTSTLELQREEKIKHAERLARAFSTIAKIGALLIGQPELVFLIDAVAGLTEMAIKSSAMGNDYDPALDEKMFALTMTIDALTLGMGKYFKGAASKIDDVVAAEQTGVKTATEVTEQAVTGEAKKELTEDAVKQVVKTEAGVASGVAKTTENVAEGGATTIAKAESAVAKAEAQVAETTVENTAADAAKKSLARQELAGNILLGAGNTIAAGEIQGESSGDIATGVLRGIFGTLIPAKLGDKIDDIFGKGKLGSVIKFGTNVASDVAVGGNSVDMALAGATGNHWQAKRAEAQHKGAAPVEEHPLAYHAEEPTTPRPVVNEESHVTKPLPSESVDPNVLAHGHNAEADHLVTSTVADESHTTKPVVEEPTRTGARSADEPTTRANVDEAQTRLSVRTGSTENGVLGVSNDPTDHRRTQHSENVSERANARRDQMDLETRTLHDQQFALAENPGQQAVLERAVAAGRSVEDVKKLRMAMTGMSEADAIQYFSGSGLIQYYHQSCVPTAYQIALAEVDPMFALHLRNNPGEMMQKQRDVLIADGAAQQPRIADNNNGSTYKEHANDPETARILSEEARYSDKGDSRGIDVGSMKDQQLHKDLEAATGTPYEIMKKRGEATKLDSVPVDRIVQAAAENKPVMYSMFGHEYVVVGSSVGADGKPVLHVQDPMSGKVSDVMPDVLAMMKVESVTLPGAPKTAETGDVARAGSIEHDESTLPKPVIDDDIGSAPSSSATDREPPPAAAAIPGTDFHGNARGKSEPEIVQTKANESVAAHARRVNGKANEDGSIEIKLPGGVKRTIRVVAEPPTADKNAPVAHYKPEALHGDGEIIIYVSDQASDHHISRAVAHDLAEIRHRLVNGEDANGPDVLSASGAPTGKLSGHDVGRLAELEVMGDEMIALKGRTDNEALEARQRLREEGKALLEHLGLDPTSEGAAERWKAIQESGIKSNFGTRAENSARMLTDGAVNPAPLPKKADQSVYGRDVSAEQVDSLVGSTTSHLGPEEMARLTELQAKAHTAEGLTPNDKAAIEILLDHNKPPDPKQVEDAKRRALEVGPGADADHAALPALPKGSVIIDSQLLITLNKNPNDLRPEEKFYLPQIKDDKKHATDLSLAGEPGEGRSATSAAHPDVGRVPLDVARDSEPYQQMLETLVRYNVGMGEGTGDRSIVADAFFARTEDKGPATLRTADDAVINSLLRMSGRDPALMGAKAYDTLMKETGKATFEVKMHGKTLVVEVVDSPNEAELKALSAPPATPSATPSPT